MTTPRDLFGGPLQPATAGPITVVSVPGAARPFFIYNRATRKSSQGFKTLAAARHYISAEFGKGGK